MEMAMVVMFLKSQNWEVGFLADLLYRPSQTSQEALLFTYLTLYFLTLTF